MINSKWGTVHRRSSMVRDNFLMISDKPLIIHRQPSMIKEKS